MSDSGSLCRTFSATCIGLDVVRVTVEVSISPGVGVFLVGLPDNAVRESLLRVTTAMQRNGFSIPGRKTVVNMAPADIKKEGSGYDAAIAVAMLTASGQMFFPNPDKFLIMGELALDGRLRKIRGALPVAVKAAEMGFRALVLPRESAAEASWAENIKVYGVSDLQEMAVVLGEQEEASVFEVPKRQYRPSMEEPLFDFSEVAGQYFAKRGLEIAASGGHNVLLYGPPGSGKSMMSKCMASILPPMSLGEAIETRVAMVGGGSRAVPGEISLAHNGVLYLDEVAQFAPGTLEVLRQPLEDRHITVSRARYKVDFPASFMLVASMNPCPCGYAGEDDGRCTCTPAMIHRYRSRLSGPFLDRIDLNINVKAVDSRSMSMAPSEESSSVVAERVAAVRALQARRFAGEGIFTNAQMLPSHLQRFCKVGDDAARLLQRLMDSYRLSARGYVRILKVARTIADMSGSEEIRPEHISEAAQYRFPDN